MRKGEQQETRKPSDPGAPWVTTAKTPFPDPSQKTPAFRLGWGRSSRPCGVYTLGGVQSLPANQDLF